MRKLMYFAIDWFLAQWHLSPYRWSGKHARVIDLLAATILFLFERNASFQKEKKGRSAMILLPMSSEYKRCCNSYCGGSRCQPSDY